jgi:pyruvate dehydrogenase E1 component alpha subunit
MAMIRAFEERVAKLFAEGQLPGFLHLYAGEEAVAVGVCAHLNDTDYITSTHRGHGHCIAKGVPLGPMVAELYGRVDGCCKGKGGSMHIAEISKGMLGANGVVGAGLPLAAGAALTARVLANNGVAVAFFGDGAAPQGAVHEAINLAAIWKLPIVFVCENNGYAEGTPFAYHSGGNSIADRAAGYGIPGVQVDGCDVICVYDVAEQAVARARAGEGPTLIEAHTVRFYGHFQGDQLAYRSAEESATIRQRDPLRLFAKQVVDAGLLTEEDITRLDVEAANAVDQAVEFGSHSAVPAPETALTDVYASYP